MSNELSVVLVQHRQESEYNDFIGKFYHFPNKYLKLLSHSDIKFVYFEPTTKKGAGVYFGYGKLGKIFEDKREKNHYFVEITEYRSFSNEVPFYDENEIPRESGPNYNPQNSARIISNVVLEEIFLDGGVILTFTSDAHLIKVLGEELIASEVVGILELVKNAYDASAKNCSVRIENIPNLTHANKTEYKFGNFEGPVIVIEDDGCGMNRNEIEFGWMRPASTIKTNVKERLKAEKLKSIKEDRLGTFKSFIKEMKKLYKGRLPLGEKGVGRFATHRLGRRLIITTKTSNIDYEYIIKIDWDKLEAKKESEPIDLDSVGFSLTRQVPSRDYGKSKSGTRLIIYGGRKGFDLTGNSIKDINRSLLRLQSPERAPSEFDVSFECPQVKELEETPIDKEFDPIFSLDALVSEKGIADIELKFNPPESVPMPSQQFNKLKYDLRKKDLIDPDYWIINNKKNGNKRVPKCGPFFMHIDIWYRITPWINGPNKKVFTDFLDNFGGISIFRDGLNIFPAEWGAEVDWLRLSKRHIKKGMKLSYYNIIGNLELEQTANIELIDKTDRQGLLENIAFRDLSILSRNIIFFVENHFIGMREKHSKLTSGLIREPKRLSEVSGQGSLLIKRIAERYDVVHDSQQILEGFRSQDSRQETLLNLSKSLKNLEKSLRAIQDVQDLLSEQAGYGLAIGVAVHEIAKITSNFYSGVTKILKSKTLDRVKLEELQEASLSLKSELNRLGPFRAIRNETPQEFNIEKAIQFCRAVFERKFNKMGIQFEVLQDGTFAVYSRYGAVNQILSNLIDNSCYWLDDVNIKNRKIIIKINGPNRSLLFADTGTDIDDTIRPYLFEPGYSLKIPPSGLGLYICKYYMRSMNGDIYEASMKDRLSEIPGAQFVLDFSRVAKRETE